MLTKILYGPLLALLFYINFATAQEGSLKGRIASDKEALAYATVQIQTPFFSKGTISNINGHYEFIGVPNGDYTITISLIGYRSVSKEIRIDPNKVTNQDFNLLEDPLSLDNVVVTGTRTAKRQTDSPVIVNLINSKTLTNVQACNLSEGLRFQPGLRVETDCQTCNYTQLRMNGLGGGYSQMLINGRPVFSSLTGLYGLEQIPVNMIERIEIVRGGGSALYGSSAIGGTVNVITKIPKNNGYNISYTYQGINGKANDHILDGNATVLSEQRTAGATFFVNKRHRQSYDENGDNFSELPQLKNTSFGTNLFFLPDEDQKLELSLNTIHEYRYGGEMVEKPAHLAQQSEERTHNVLMGSLDYQINFNEYQNSLIIYMGGQYTARDHYTGIFPDTEPAIAAHLANPPYGTSNTTTLQGGVQYNHKLSAFLGGKTVITLGAEYLYDAVFDGIESYNYRIDQTTKNVGTFLQNDWDMTPSINLLTGFRLDKHNLLKKAIFSPRVSLLYKYKKNTQIRLSWGTGFRAPQAFDADLHIAFAGGGVSRISLDPKLMEEKSNSISSSINYDKGSENFIAGFTLEGFYTYLKDAFYQFPLGEDGFGQRFEKRNGSGATVKGFTLETRANYKGQLQLEAGFTWQSSIFDEAVENIEGLDPKKTFLRTPNDYGYLTLTYTPNAKLNISMNAVHTGKMELAHFAGAPEQTMDSYLTSRPFTELSFRTAYTVNLKKLATGLEFFGGIKNISNAYQSDFDPGKNRDSNYIYGPSLPRTFFVGLRIKSL